MTKLLLDMDGPLADFCNGIGRGPGHPLRGFKDDVPEMYEPGFFKSLPVTDGAKEAVHRLVQSGQFEIGICSKPLAVRDRPAYTSASEKYEWLHEHFPELVERVTLTWCKSLVHADLLIDDDTKWIEKFRGGFIHFDVQNPKASWEDITDMLIGPIGGRDA